MTDFFKYIFLWIQLNSVGEQHGIYGDRYWLVKIEQQGKIEGYTSASRDTGDK